MELTIVITGDDPLPEYLLNALARFAQDQSNSLTQFEVDSPADLPVLYGSLMRFGRPNIGAVDALRQRPVVVVTRNESPRRPMDPNA
jgi:hypothetical protein